MGRFANESGHARLDWTLSSYTCASAYAHSAHTYVHTVVMLYHMWAAARSACVGGRKAPRVRVCVQSARVERRHMVSRWDLCFVFQVYKVAHFEWPDVIHKRNSQQKTRKKKKRKKEKKSYASASPEMLTIPSSVSIKRTADVEAREPSVAIRTAGKTGIMHFSKRQVPRRASRRRNCVKDDTLEENRRE